MLCYRTVPFAIGKLTIMEKNGKIVRIKLNRPPEPAIHAVEKETSLIAEAISQLSAYFEGRLKTFDLPLDMSGTPFRMKTWEALKTIPYGETRSYGDIARQPICTYYGKIADLPQMLYENGFLQVSRSDVVNMKYVCGIRSYKMTLKNGVELSISRPGYAAIRSAYLEWKGQYVDE